MESDIFYEICDREGILVWQDFLFACGNYPGSTDFIEQVKVEAEQQVKRVGYHARLVSYYYSMFLFATCLTFNSLVLWAGNNEDYMVKERWDWDDSNFPAAVIYEQVLPEICARLAGDVPYWRSSPYGGAFANDTTVGDTHCWDGMLLKICSSSLQ